MEYTVDFTAKTVTKPKFHTEDIEVIIAALPTSDFKTSDWLVCYPEDYPITDFRCHSHMKFWGINNNQIVRKIEKG